MTRSPTETTPPTINDDATAARVRAAITAGLGEGVLLLHLGCCCSHSRQAQARVAQAAHATLP